MRRQSGAGAMAALTLTMVFGAALLTSLAAGAVVYRRVADRVERSAGERVGLAYLTAKLHSGDEAGMARAGKLEGLDAVYLLQEVDGLTYETILYVHDGWLKELFCEEGWELGPESGQAITQARALEVSQPEPGLLRLAYTGADGLERTADVYLRSGG